MDRRQKKSREAIFRAFSELLAENNVQHITVGQIIARADVGRATFYAHFETKEYLLKALSQELFCHLFDAIDHRYDHRHIFSCDNPAPAFEHLFFHLKNNDNQLLRLLSGENADSFLPYFISGLLTLIENQKLNFQKPSDLPDDFWHGHISAAFVQTLRWWVEHGTVQSPEEITRWFLLSVNCSIV